VWFQSESCVLLWTKIERFGHFFDLSIGTDVALANTTDWWVW